MDLSRGQQIAACRAALELVRPLADRLQIDVPWMNAGSWPEEAVAAASTFAPRRKDYELSGWVMPIEEHHWQAYVALAPSALSSDVWTTDMTELADVSDEGTVIFVRVPLHELDRLRIAVAPARVV